MSFFVRRIQGTDFQITDLGIIILAGAEYDIEGEAGIPMGDITNSADLAAAFASSDLLRITGAGGSVIPPGQAFEDTVQAHVATHQQGGSDPLDVTGLSGVLADAQTPSAHTHVASEVTDFQATVDSNANVSANTTHRGLTNNPHSTSLANLGAGVLADLNNIVGDATLDDASAPRPPQAHTHVASEVTDFTAAVNAVAEVLAAFTHASITGGGNPHGNTTSDIPEGSNLYFTDQRVTDNLSVQLNTNHRNSTSNPHNTTLANLGGGTLADLNAAVTDATLDDAASPRPPLAHTHVASEVTDFDAAVSANTDVVANTNHRGLTNNPHSTTAVQVGAIPTTEKGAVNGVATLDAGGKIPAAQIPAVALPQLYVVADAAARLALTVQEGDEAIQLDDGSQWIFDGSVWVQRPIPSQGVTNTGTSTDNAIARFDGATGQIIQTSQATVTDDGTITAKKLDIASNPEGVENHVQLLVDSDLTGDPYNLNLNATDLGRIYSRFLDGNFRQASVWTSDAFGGKTIFGVSRSRDAGSSWQPVFTVNEALRVGVNTNNPAQTLDVNGSGIVRGNLSVTGTVDGVDIANDSATNAAHRADTGNPHDTSLANLQGGTLAQLNSLVSDATLDDASAPRPPQAHTHTASQITDFQAAVSANTDVQANTTHRGLTNNPHATSIANIGQGTLAQLNAALTDATLSEAGAGVTSTSLDKDLTPLDTAGDEQDTGITITATPVGFVAVAVNNVIYRTLDGTKTGGGFFFSSDNGVTARAISNITAGDKLFFNGESLPIVFDLEADCDRIDLHYLTEA